MSYYEFTVQIYGDEELAKMVYGNVKLMEGNIDALVSVLWKIKREAVRLENLTCNEEVDCKDCYHKEHCGDLPNV